MRIFVSHATSFDFQHKLYIPLKESSFFQQHQIFLPHDSDNFSNTKNTIQSSDLILAEVSYPSTGQGIELGWANDSNRSIICFYKQESKPSRSLEAITTSIFPYANASEMIERLARYIDILTT